MEALCPSPTPNPHWVQIPFKIPFRQSTKQAAALGFESVTLSIPTYEAPGFPWQKPFCHQRQTNETSTTSVSQCLALTAPIYCSWMLPSHGQEHGVCSALFPFQLLKCLSRNRALYVTAKKARINAASSLRSYRTVESQLSSLTCHRTFVNISLFTLLSHETLACDRAGSLAAGRFC